MTLKTQFWTTFLKRVRSWPARSRIKAAMRDGSRKIEDLWPDIARIFSAAKVVYMGPVGPAAWIPLEAEILMFLQNHPEGGRTLKEHINHENANVSAYCVAGLKIFGQSAFASVPSALYERSEIIRWRSACFSDIVSLGTFAKDSVNYAPKRE